MSEKIKTVIVQYLLMHLSVETIRSKLKLFHSYMISRQALFICITLSNSGNHARTQKNEKQHHTFVIILKQL